MKKCSCCRLEKPIADFNKNPQKKDGKHPYCQSCDRQKHRDWYKKQREEVLKHYGSVCACCGEDRYEFLSIDHIDGGGNTHRKKLGSSAVNFGRWLKKNGFPKGYRVLCMNCNHAIGRYGYCPHDCSSTTGLLGKLT